MSNSDILVDGGTNRTSPPEHQRWALTYMLAAMDEQEARTRREKSRDNLKQWITDNCEQDENGNYRWEFDSPMTTDGETWITGLELQRRTSEFIDENQAEAIIRKHGLEERCLIPVTETYIDFDALYAANQEGVVPDEDIDSILSYNETYALIKIKE